MAKTFGIENDWWSIKNQKWVTLEEGIAERWEDRLQTLREKSVAGIGFTDSLAVVITNEEYRELSEDKRRELIQAWLYPTNDNGEVG